MGKTKPAKPAAAAGKGAGRGGAGRGQGRKAKGATPVAKPAAPDPAAPKRTQQSLADLLGARMAPTPKRPAVLASEVLKWNVKDDDGNDVPQKQVKEGPVEYGPESEKEWVIVKLGSEETHHRYLHDADDKEVPQKATRARWAIGRAAARATCRSARSARRAARSGCRRAT